MGRTHKSKNKKFFSYDDFDFYAIAYDCEIGVTPKSKNLKKHTFYLYPNGRSLSYRFINGKELINCANGRSVLSDLLAIRDGDVEDAKSFIEMHGFLLTLLPNSDNSIESETLFILINRLKATVSLMSAFAESDKTLYYEKIMALTMYLLLEPQSRIEQTCGQEPYKTCPHNMSLIWHKANYVNEHKEEIELKRYGMVGLERVLVKDTVRPPATELNTYGDNLFVISKDNKHKYIELGVADKAATLFVGAKNAPDYCRLAIDFLHHFCISVGDVKKWNYKGELILGKSSPPTPHPPDTDDKDLFDIKPDDPTKSDKELLLASLAKALEKNSEEATELNNSPDPAVFENGFDNQLAEALMKLAKHTLKTEIEHNLQGVAPSYDAEILAPTWHIEHLLSGLYFSLFNIRTTEEQYRICARTKCGRYFLTKNDSTKQKYCSYSCSNATAQSNHRSKSNKKRKV